MAKKYEEGLTRFEALSLAKERGMKLVPHKRADALVSNGAWHLFHGAFPVRSGTLVAYPKANGKIGDSISRKDPESGEWHIINTSEFKGESGIALILKSGDYEFVREEGTALYLPKKGARIYVSEEFPQESGWCGVRGFGAIPVMNGNNTRFVLRDDKESIALVSRDPVSGDHLDIRKIDMRSRPSQRMGVLLEPLQ